MRTVSLHLGAFAIASTLGCVSSLAADLPIKATKPSATEQNVFVQPDATCVSWTDGCRICQSHGPFGIACSNVSIICQQENVRCTMRKSPEPSKN